MMCSRWLVGLASTAPSLSAGVLICLLSGWTRRLLFGIEPPRIYKARAVITDPYTQSENIDSPAFIQSERCRLEVVEEVLRGVGEEADQHTDSGNRKSRYFKVFAYHADSSRVRSDCRVEEKSSKKKVKKAKLRLKLGVFIC